MFKDKAANPQETPIFELDASGYAISDPEKTSHVNVATSITVYPLYVVLLISAAFLGFTRIGVK
jgi:hypothetical protein